MTDPFRVPRPTDDEQAFALSQSAAAGRPSKWLSVNVTLQSIGVVASLVGMVVGTIAAFYRYPADCEAGGSTIAGSDGTCYTHAFAAGGVGIVAVSVALLLVVTMLGRLLRTMPALVVATGAHQYLDGKRATTSPPDSSEDD